MNRRDFLQAAAGASLYSLLPHAQAAEAAAKKRNVLYLMVDDLRCDLGCYGVPEVQSPNIDRLAKRGVMFDRAYCQFPVCNPSRWSSLSGLRPETTGILTNAMTDSLRFKKPDAVTLPQLFRQNGYYTASLGKVIHIGINAQGKPAGEQDPLSWDFCKEYGPPDGDHLGAIGGDYTPKLTGKGQPDWCWWSVDDNGRDTGDVQVAENAVKQLEEHKDGPFFIAAGFHKPHNPYIAPQKFFDLYPPGTTKLPQQPADRSPVPPMATAKNDWFANFSDEDKIALRRAYHACTSFTDSQLGIVLDAMDRLQLWDNTIVVLLVDHGYMHWEHEFWAKPTAYEQTARVPCIVWVPGLAGMGRTAHGIVESLDMYPTLAELAGLTAPATLEGTSFVPLLRDPTAKGKEGAYTLMWGNQGRLAAHSVRTDRWRYTEFADGTAALYDHEKDPGEYYNLATNPEQKDNCAQLSQLLHKIRMA